MDQLADHCKLHDDSTLSTQPMHDKPAKWHAVSLSRRSVDCAAFSHSPYRYL